MLFSCLLSYFNNPHLVKMSTGSMTGAAAGFPKAKASGCLQNRPTTKQQNKTIQSIACIFITHILFKTSPRGCSLNISDAFKPYTQLILVNAHVRNDNVLWKISVTVALGRGLWMAGTVPTRVFSETCCLLLIGNWHKSFLEIRKR